MPATVVLTAAVEKQTYSARWATQMLALHDGPDGIVHADGAVNHLRTDPVGARKSAT